MITLPENLIKQATVNGSITRYADIPCDKPTVTDTAILFIAGHKSPLERFFPFSEYFAQFAHTYNYEIPGMGISQRNPQKHPTIDAFSDEIADFIYNYITEKNIIVVAGSIAFWFITQAILNNPQLEQRITKVIVVYGALGKDSFSFSPLLRAFAVELCKLIQTPIGRKLTARASKNATLVNWYAEKVIRRRHLTNLPPDAQREHIEFEKFLLQTGDWHVNFTAIEQYLTKDIHDIRKLAIQILAFYTGNDQYFPLERQKVSFSRVYDNISWVEIPAERHSPLLVKDVNEYEKVLPHKEIVRFLSK